MRIEREREVSLNLLIMIREENSSRHHNHLESCVHFWWGFRLELYVEYKRIKDLVQNHHENRKAHTQTLM